jgi:glutathione synthase/RimK-type ligase-like ATP-grasp enzyme
VVKPAVGAGGRGVEIVEPAGVRAPGSAGPWVVQPLVASVRTTGESSVFVLDGNAVAQVDKRPADGEIRVQEEYGGVSAPAALGPEQVATALSVLDVAAALLDRDIAYARVDLLHHDGRWMVSELELTEPGLYLDVLPTNAAPFADLLAGRLGGS